MGAENDRNRIVGIDRKSDNDENRVSDNRIEGGK